MTEQDVPDDWNQNKFESGLGELLDLDIVEAGPERVVIGVEVDERLHQPFGIMHGGVNLVLAETAASIGASLASPEGKHGVGIEINANHLKPVRRGYIKATATPVRIQSSLHVWSVEVALENGTVTSVSRCTLTIREHRVR